MKFLVTGATGFVGRSLCKRLVDSGHDLAVISRSSQGVVQSIGLRCQVFACDLSAEQPSPSIFAGVHGVVHLAGDPIADGRWTDEKKKRIYDSRVLGSNNLVSAIKKIGENGPRVLIAASAIGFYGDRADEIVTEETPRGKDFLSNVCADWEREILDAETPSKIRRVALRVGMVLGRSGGALGKMLPIFRAGLGGPIGSGNQWVSWIHIDDLVSLIEFSLTNERVEGALNAVSPAPLTSTDFSDALALAVGKKARFRVPEFAMRVGLGELTDVLLSSQRVIPKRALDHQFKFKYPEITSALKDIVG